MLPISLMPNYSILGDEAIAILEKKHHNGFSLCREILHNSIQRSNINLSQAQRLHSLFISHEALTSSSSLADVFIGLFGSFNRLLEANLLFQQVKKKTIFTWEAMISSHSVEAEHLTALYLYQEMERSDDGFLFPGKKILSCVLKSCSNGRFSSEGMLIHDKVIRENLESEIYIGSSLIDMYAKCGHTYEAQKVFDQLPDRNEVTWNTLISGYAQFGHDLSAMNLFVEMHQSGVKAGKVTFLCLLKLCCSKSRSLCSGRLLHNLIIEGGFESEIAIGSALVDMYSKCGNIEEAHSTFVKISNKNKVTWGAMISAYAQHGYGHLAIEGFNEMQQMGIKPDEVLFSCVLKGLADIRLIEKGMQTHNQIIVYGLDGDLVLGTALIDMYINCRDPSSAYSVFKALPCQNVITWSAIISGYVEHGHIPDALQLFEEMHKHGIKPDMVAFLCLLQACTTTPPRYLSDGMIIHFYVIEMGLETDSKLENGLVDMYSKCGMLKDTQKMCDLLPFQRADVLNKKISAYAQLGQDDVVLKLFGRMQYDDLNQGIDTVLLVLKSCATVEDLWIGRKIHKWIVKKKMELDLTLGNTLLNMYVKCGALEEAHEVFNEMRTRDVVSWGIIIAGYAECDHGNHALRLFKRMQDEGLEPDNVVFSCVLRACGAMGSIEHGKIVHDQFLRSGLVLDSVAGNIIVDMYAKCGSLQDAWKMFYALPERTKVSWNSIISACAHHGMYHLAEHCLVEMEQKGLKPSGATYNCIFTACSHAGQVEEGRKFFNSMVEDDHVTPSTEHFNCVSDIFARAGCLQEAEELLQILPVLPSATSRTSLLTACKNHSNLCVGFECYGDPLAQSTR